MNTSNYNYLLNVAPISQQVYFIPPTGTSFYNVSTPSMIRGRVALRMWQENTMHQQTYLRLTLYTTRPSTVVNNITSVLGAMTRRKQYKFFSNHVVSFKNLNSLMYLNRHFKCLFTIQITQLQVTYVTQITFCNLFSFSGVQ